MTILGPFEPPAEVQVNAGEEIYSLNHTNTWLYSYTVEPYHNFVLHERADTWVRIFNNPILFDRLFQLNHNIVSEWEPNEVVRAAYDTINQYNAANIVEGCEHLLEEL